MLIAGFVGTSPAAAQATCPYSRPPDNPASIYYHLWQFVDVQLPVQDNPPLVSTYLRLGKVTAEGAQHEAAATYFTASIRHALDTIENTLPSDTMMLDNNIPLDAWLRVLALYHDLADAHYQRGLSWSALERPDDAIEDFTQALAWNPILAAAYESRGVTHFQLGNAAAAIDDLTCAIGLEPDDASHYHARGWAYEMRGDDALAIADFEQVLLLEPQQHPGLCQSGQCAAPPAELCPGHAGLQPGAGAEPAKCRRLQQSWTGLGRTGFLRPGYP